MVKSKISNNSSNLSPPMITSMVSQPWWC